MRLRETLANFATGGTLLRLAEQNAQQGHRIQEFDREVERLKEDLQWARLGQTRDQTDRQTVRNNCRWAFQRSDVFVKGAVKLLTEFCFGQGIDGPSSDDDATQAKLDKFWWDPENQGSMFSTVSQYRSSFRLLLDGDHFTLLQKKPGALVTVHYVPAEYITDIITDPEDGEHVLYYKAQIPTPEWDDSTQAFRDLGKHVCWYKDIYNDGSNDPLDGKLGTGLREGVILHTNINAVDAADFGWPEPAASLGWFQASKEIAWDQGTLSRSSASLANKMRVDGSAAQIDTIRDALRTQGQNEDDRYNKNVAGQFNITNDQVQFDLSRMLTNAGDAWTNSRIMRIAGCAGLGMPLHFLSDPENANLATSTSMERPVLEHLRGYQSIWVDTYRKLCDYVLGLAGKEGAPYDIPVPRIIAADVGTVGRIVLDGQAQGLLSKVQAASWLLDALGFDDIATELENIAEESGIETEGPGPLEVIEESTW